MKVRLLEVARDELRNAAQYYNAQRKGLGKEFRAEFRRALALVRKYPNAWHPLSEHTRRCLINRFPYGVIYQVRPNEILIVAVAHLHRKPDYWGDRL